MKGNKMSAILAILLMLSGAVFVPHAFAQTPANSVVCNPAAINWTYPAHAPGGPGDTWTMYADVDGVTDLFLFQIGFYFNPTAVQIISVAEGGFLSNNGVDSLLAFPGTIDNVNGKVTPYGWSLTDTNLAKSTPVGTFQHLITVQAKINPALVPPIGPVPMMDLTTVDGDPVELILLYKDGISDISPPENSLVDGMFTLSLPPPSPPTAIFTMSPPPYYVNIAETDDATGSLPGFDGINFLPIVNYHWDFGDGNTLDTPNPITTHAYLAAGPYTVTLTVTDSSGQVSAPVSHDKVVLAAPSGCVLDVFTQGWRYIDPTTYTGVLQGKGPGYPAELFRPGDYVQLYTTTIYNGDPVQGQLVSYEVHDNNGILVLAGVARSNENGLAEYDFRVPWPCPPAGAESMFGTWTVYVSWEIGTMEGPPYAKTQNDTLTFNVGWGIWSDGVTTDKAEYFKSEIVVIKVNIHNDYSIPIYVLTTADIFDDLMVPIGGVAYVGQTFAANSVTPVTFAGIHVEKWAFAGLGTVKVNEFSTWPSAMGTAWCPEQVATFVIKQTFNPPDP